MNGHEFSYNKYLRFFLPQISQISQILAARYNGILFRLQQLTLRLAARCEIYQNRGFSRCNGQDNL